MGSDDLAGRKLNELPRLTSAPSCRSGRRGRLSNFQFIAALRVMFGVRIEKTANHPLVLRVVPRGLTLEELDAALAQGKRHLDAVFLED